MDKGQLSVTAEQMTTGPGATDTRDDRFGSKVGQIGPKWDKSGTF